MYDVEMQAVYLALLELALRMRYYQNIIDVDFLKKGSNYTDLKDVYIIFICNFDPLKLGRAYYTFSTICEEDHTTVLPTGVTYIILNAKAWKKADDPELAAFLRYVAHGEIGSNFVEELHAEVMHIKNDERVEMRYMKLIDEIERAKAQAAAEAAAEALEKGKREGMKKGKKEGMKEGMKKGKKKGKIEGIFESQLNMIRKLRNSLKWTLEQAMEFLAIPMSERGFYLKALAQ